MELKDKEKFIFGGLFLLSNKLQVIGDKYLEKDDMTIKQWFLALMVLQFHDHAPTLSEVADLMGSSRQNVKQLALKLEEKDFMTIEKDEHDARALRLRLTERHDAFWKSREYQDDQFIVDLFKDFSEEEIDNLVNGFNKLFEKIEKMIKNEE